MTRNCRLCGDELTDENWYPSRQRKRDYICKECWKEKSRLYSEANRDKVNAYARLYREANRDKVNTRKRLYRKNNPEKVKAESVRDRLKNGQLPMSENKECASYLGVHINERLLKHLFDDVEVMPYGNPGFDFICNNGKKIDGKSSCLNKDGRWKFTINHNTTADYFFCVAYDNRRNLNIIHIWMLPGDKFNHLKMTSVSPSTIHKWDEYKQNVDGAVSCCDTMRGEQK